MAKQIVKMPKAVKTMLALTPREKSRGFGDLPKVPEGSQPPTMGLKSLFLNAVIAEQNARLSQRKSRDSKEAADK